MWRRRLNRTRRHQSNWDNIGSIRGRRSCLDGLSIVKWIANGLPTRGTTCGGGKRTLRSRVEINDAISRGVHSNSVCLGGWCRRCRRCRHGGLTFFYRIGTIENCFRWSRDVWFAFGGFIAGPTCTLTTAVQEEDKQGAYEDKQNRNYCASKGTGTDTTIATATAVRRICLTSERWAGVAGPGETVRSERWVQFMGRTG